MSSESSNIKSPIVVSQPSGMLAEWISDRVKIWDEIKSKKQEQLKEQQQMEQPIKVTLPDGKQLDEVAFKSSPATVAKSISNTLAQNLIVAEVNGEAWDVNRPFECDSQLVLHTFDSPKGKNTFWHSSAHVLGEALELLYSCHLTIGPPLEEGGFYYDMSLDKEKKATIGEPDYEDIKKFVAKIIKEKQSFERMVVSKAEALQLFAYNKYKKQIITDKIPEDGVVTAYRCGPLIDLCRGPHIPHTGRIKAFEITKNSSSYWLGDAANDSLQRVYGISFPDNKLLKEWQTRQEEAKRRDHRNIGKNQELFFMDVVSPGSVFFLPHGTIIYNKLMDFIRSAYRQRGFTEVISPNIYNIKLWETSGHWQNYAENMFSFEVEKQLFAMKPMNCPGHCVIFGHRARSYRELPLRFADFGVLHRNELSGALTGLTRVRRFQQDDAHIFCRKEQIHDELKNALDFMEFVYGIFGFKFDLELSTRPEKFLGDISVWDNAELMMKSVLESSGHPWKLNPGDGAFYGPKIDIHITDALDRSHQCATIQLDFQLPERFKLEYQTESNDGSAASMERPVIIHRAIYGSVERFLAILMEHVAGEWPFWLSPRQFLIIPVTEKTNQYAENIRQRLHDAGFYAETDCSSGRVFMKKLALAVTGYHNYVLVVGNKEEEEDSVSVRTKKFSFGKITIEDLTKRAKDVSTAYRAVIWDDAEGTAVSDGNPKKEQATSSKGGKKGGGGGGKKNSQPEAPASVPSASAESKESC